MKGHRICRISFNGDVVYYDSFKQALEANPGAQYGGINRCMDGYIEDHVGYVWGFESLGEIMKEETAIRNRILVECTSGHKDTRNNVRLWNCPTGSAYRGSFDKKENVIRNPLLIKYGLCKGGSDLIGFKTVQITPDMVGKRVAVFTALEVKTDKGLPSDEQLDFLEMVKGSGGIAGIVRSVESARSLLVDS